MRQFVISSSALVFSLIIVRGSVGQDAPSRTPPVRFERLHQEIMKPRQLSTGADQKAVPGPDPYYFGGNIPDLGPLAQRVRATSDGFEAPPTSPKKALVGSLTVYEQVVPGKLKPLKDLIPHKTDFHGRRKISLRNADEAFLVGASAHFNLNATPPTCQCWGACRRGGFIMELMTRKYIDPKQISADEPKRKTDIAAIADGCEKEFIETLEQLAAALPGTEEYQVKILEVTKHIPPLVKIQVIKQTPKGDENVTGKYIPLLLVLTRGQGEKPREGFIDCISPGDDRFGKNVCFVFDGDPKTKSGSDVRFADPLTTDDKGYAEIPLTHFRRRSPVRFFPNDSTVPAFNSIILTKLVQLQPVPPFDRIRYDRLADIMAKQPRGKPLTMQLQVWADSNLTAAQMPHPGKIAMQREKPILAKEHFNVRSATHTLTVNRIAEIVDVGNFGGGVDKPRVLHPWDSEGKPKSWHVVTETPFPLQPSDRVSLQDRESVTIKWLDGTRYLFSVKHELLGETKPATFWISPTQPEDWADRANYPDSVRKYVALVRSDSPWVAFPRDKMAGSGLSWVVKKRGVGDETVAGLIVKVITFGFDKATEPPVIVTWLESSAVYDLRESPQLFLIEGKLTLLDDKGEKQQVLAPGQVLRFDLKGKPIEPASFAQSDLPKGIPELLQSIDKHDAERKAKATPPNEGAGADGQSNTIWWILGGLVLLLSACFIASRFVIKRRIGQDQSGRSTP